MTQRLRNWLIGAVLVVVGVLVGYALPQHTASPKSETGTITQVRGAMGGKGATLVFKEKGQRGTVSFPMQDPIPWQANSSGGWHGSGQPSCLASGTKVTLGVITVHSNGSTPGGPMIVWVKCYG